MRPDFVIIGAQKSGSTALMKQLADHPSVYLPEQETRYFRYPWFEFQDVSVLDDAVATERDVLRRGIKCPDYLAEPDCPQRLRAVLGEVELIAVLREPVQRALSAYFWGMQWGWVPYAPPEVGIARLLDGALDTDHPRAREVLDYGRYGEHLARYLEVFPPSKLDVILTDDLRRAPDAALRQVFTFLGVDAEVEIPAQDRQVNTGVYSPTRLKLLSRRHKHILREFPGYEGKYLQPAQGTWSRTVNRAISVSDRVILSRLCNNDAPTISAGLRERMTDYYRPDVDTLRQVIGRDLTEWIHFQA